MSVRVWVRVSVGAFACVLVRVWVGACVWVRACVCAGVARV